MPKDKYKPKTKYELIDLIEKTKFNKTDTSFITDMSVLFKYSMLRNFSSIETLDINLLFFVIRKHFLSFFSSYSIYMSFKISI